MHFSIEAKRAAQATIHSAPGAMRKTAGLSHNQEEAK